MSRIDAGTDDVEPIGRNGLHSLLAGHHEGERGKRMAVALGAVARRFSTAPMRNGERAWEGILWEMKAGQQAASAAPEAGGLRTEGRRDVTVHLTVIIQSDTPKNNTLEKCSLGCLIGSGAFANSTVFSGRATGVRPSPSVQSFSSPKRLCTLVRLVSPRAGRSMPGGQADCAGDWRGGLPRRRDELQRPGAGLDVR